MEVRFHHVHNAFAKAMINMILFVKFSFIRYASYSFNCVEKFNSKIGFELCEKGVATAHT